MYVESSIRAYLLDNKATETMADEHNWPLAFLMYHLVIQVN